MHTFTTADCQKENGDFCALEKIEFIVIIIWFKIYSLC